MSRALYFVSCKVRSRLSFLTIVFFFSVSFLRRSRLNFRVKPLRCTASFGNLIFECVGSRLLDMHASLNTTAHCELISFLQMASYFLIFDRLSIECLKRVEPIFMVKSHIVRKTNSNKIRRFILLRTFSRITERHRGMSF